MNAISIKCEKCGGKMECPPEDAGGKVLCKFCFHANKVPKAETPWDNLELDGGDDVCSRSTRGDDVLSATTRERNEAQEAEAKQVFFRSEDIPPAPPTQPKDPDKALTGVAIGIFRMKNWPCQEEPGYKAFRAKVKFHSTNLGNVTSIDDYRVSASHGVLLLETPVVELPPLSNVPLLEMLNEINQRSISSVFFLNETGVMMRHALIPHPREEGFLTPAMILQTLRQINHDRRHALSLIREAVECKKLDPAAIAQAFANPAAPSTIRSHSLDQAADMGSFAGFHVNKLNGQFTLSKDIQPADKCALHVAALSGFIRGWVTLDDSSHVHGAWNVMTASFREMLKNIRTKPYKILEQVNEMNKKAELVRFTYTKRHMVASAAMFPTDEPVSVEQFKIFAEALLKFAHSDQGAPPLAKAG